MGVAISRSVRSSCRAVRFSVAPTGLFRSAGLGTPGLATGAMVRRRSTAGDWMVERRASWRSSGFFLGFVGGADDLGWWEVRRLAWSSVRFFAVDCPPQLGQVHGFYQVPLETGGPGPPVVAGG